MYLFEGATRLTIFQYTPNETAALAGQLVLLILCLYLVAVARGRYVLAMVALAIAAPLFLVIGHTASRGGVLSLIFGICGAVWFKLRVLAGIPSARFRVTMAGAFCLVLVGAASLWTGVVRRANPSYLAKDASAINRWKMCQTFPMLLKDSDFRGWGPGMAGRVYSNWYSEISDKPNQNSLASTYFDLIGDHGALAIVLILTIFSHAACVVLVASSRTEANISLVMSLVTTAATAEAIFFCISSAFSSFRNIEFLLLPATCVVGCILVTARGHLRRFVTLLAYSSASAITATVFAIIAIYLTGPERRFYVQHAGQGKIYIRSAESKTRERIVYDEIALGKVPGRTIRAWIEGNNSVGVETEIIPNIAERTIQSFEPPARVILLGTSVEALRSAQWETPTLLFLPSTSPPSAKPMCPVSLVLGAIDEQGLNDAWREWARINGCKVSELADAGSVVPDGVNPLKFAQ